MGVVIQASATTTGTETGALAHAVSAARRCLERAGVAGEEVGLLLYVGLYRDDNIVEPAIAALVQRELGMCLDYAKGGRPGFSFDILNGACGVLNAVQIAQAYLASGQVSRALVVSADAHPSGHDHDGFPYAASGAALLLGLDERVPGFGRLYVLDEDDGDDRSAFDVEGFLSFGEAGTSGRKHITVRRDQAAAARAVALLSTALTRAVSAEGLALDDVVVVTTRWSPGFSAALAAACGVSVERVWSATGWTKDPVSSALTIAYDDAVRSGRLSAKVPVLFAAVGSGLTTACVLLRP